MTGSRAERRIGLALAATLVLLAACATPAPTPIGSPMQPLQVVGARVPDDVDIIARDLAAAALADSRLTSEAWLVQLEMAEKSRAEQGLAPTGLVPVATDLVNATHDDAILYRAATAELLERDGIRTGLQNRLSAGVEDDPLKLADARIRDAWIKDTAEVFNAFARPASKMIYTPVVAGISLARSLFALALRERVEDKLEFRERQALSHWKRFLELHPDAPEAPEIALRVEEKQRRWNETRRDQLMRSARSALRRGQWDAALVLATRAERFWPEDAEALEIRSHAREELIRFHESRARTLEASPRTLEIDTTPAARALAVAMLLPEAEVIPKAEAILAESPDGPAADEARFVLSLAHREAQLQGTEDFSWDVLGDLADDSHNMARHASALVSNPRQNPWSAFREARRADSLDKVKWVMLGPFAGGPAKRDLPRAVEWLVDLPSIAQTLTSFPNRLVQLPWMSNAPFGKRTAIHAERYLAKNPEGAHADEVADWLREYHGDQGNHLAAWEIATGERAEPDSGFLPKLRSRAARQALEGARKQTQGDVRMSMLHRVARSFQGTDAAAEAASLAREELMKATTQRIRISRGFLLENPAIAGPHGLALRPELLDGDNSNGELHPEGVVLAGGRVLEFNYVGKSGKHRDASVRHLQKVSDERLARIVSLLDETALANYMVDSGDVLTPDADRDRFFERARLGVADTPDFRPNTRSTYQFKSLRERYGLVRGREPILPFDIVFSGSLPDMSFGVYPRMRAPRPTPDSILYK